MNDICLGFHKHTELISLHGIPGLSIKFTQVVVQKSIEEKHIDMKKFHSVETIEIVTGRVRCYWKLLSRNSEGWKDKKGWTGLLLTDPLFSSTEPSVH